MIYFASIFFVIFNAIMYVSVIPYTCQPYKPEEDCATGLYQIRLYEQPSDRNPIGVVDAHCVVTMPGRLRAEQVRFTSYSKYSREILDVEWMEDQEFPVQNTEVCSWR